MPGSMSSNKGSKAEKITAVPGDHSPTNLNPPKNSPNMANLSRLPYHYNVLQTSINLHDESIPTFDLMGGRILSAILQKTPTNDATLLSQLIGDVYWNPSDVSRFTEPIANWMNKISDVFTARLLLLAGFSHERIEADELFKNNPSGSPTTLVDFLIRHPTLSVFDFTRINTMNQHADYSFPNISSSPEIRVKALFAMLRSAGWIPTLAATGTGMKKLRSISHEELVKLLHHVLVYLSNAVEEETHRNFLRNS